MKRKHVAVTFCFQNVQFLELLQIDYVKLFINDPYVNRLCEVIY